MTGIVFVAGKTDDAVIAYATGPAVSVAADGWVGAGWWNLYCYQFNTAQPGVQML